MCTHTVPLAVTLGSYFSQSHCFHKACTCTPYSSPPPHTHTHHSCTHTQARTTCSDIKWVHCFHEVFIVHECTHLCTHIGMYTAACTPYICHTYSTYTYSTLALLRKWHNTYIHSCTVHLYARIQMKNIHSHTHMYIVCNVYSAKLVLCTCTCIVFHLTALCMYFDFYTLCTHSVSLHAVDNFLPCV